jgi:glutathione synthase/RimK-type ligase-like ATP-grasp enzyme
MAIKKSIIIIGDPMMTSRRFEPSLNGLLCYAGLMKKRYENVIFITYDDLTSLRLPDIGVSYLYLLFFFPYTHWNSNIERYDKDNRIYGDISFGMDFKKYLYNADRIIKEKYHDKKIFYINSPYSSIIDRDKLKTHNILKQAGIATPDIFHIKDTKSFYSAVERYGSLYIKPRFGAMGKGISFADRTGIYTNFGFRSKKIISRVYDYNWPLIRLPKRYHRLFVGMLIKKGFVFQRAVEPLVYRKRRFDIRVYTACGKIPYMYAKSSPQNNIVTNWSQGGRIEKKPFLCNALSPYEIKNIKAVSLEASTALGLGYAGVDIIMGRHTRSINVLEIQSFPGYEKGFDLMRFLAENI